MERIKSGVIIAFISLIFFLSAIACSGSRKVFNPPQSTDRVVTVKEIVRDTVFQTQPDSSALQALIECQNGKAVIKEIVKTEPGKSHLQLPKATIKNNVLTVDCKASAQKLLATWKEQHKNEVKTVTVTHTEYKERELTGWQRLYLWIGKIAIFLIIGVAIVYLVEITIKKHQ